jgi:hypothetical protein
LAGIDALLSLAAKEHRQEKGENGKGENPAGKHNHIPFMAYVSHLKAHPW